MKGHQGEHNSKKDVPFKSINGDHDTKTREKYHAVIRSQIQQIDRYLKHQIYLSDKDNRQLTQIIIDYYSEVDSFDLRSEIREILTTEDLKLFDRGTTAILLMEKLLNQAGLLSKLVKLPYQIAEVISKFIEMLDLIKLPIIAKRPYIQSMIDELIIKLDYLSYLDTAEIVNDILGWKTRLNPNKMNRIMFRRSEILSPKLCEQLELDLSKWIEAFKLKLVNIDYTSIGNISSRTPTLA